MSEFASDAPTQPLPAVTEPAGPSLPIGRLAALSGASILSGVLLAAAQSWRPADMDEPGFARTAVWIVVCGCLLTGALALLGFVSTVLWTAVMAVNRGADERRAAVDRIACAQRQAERGRLRRIALDAARTEAGAPTSVQATPPPLRLLRRETQPAAPGARSTLP